MRITNMLRFDNHENFSQPFSEFRLKLGWKVFYIVCVCVLCCFTCETVLYVLYMKQHCQTHTSSHGSHHFSDLAPILVLGLFIFRMCGNIWCFSLRGHVEANAPKQLMRSVAEISVWTLI